MRQDDIYGVDVDESPPTLDYLPLEAAIDGAPPCVGHLLLLMVRVCLSLYTCVYVCVCMCVHVSVLILLVWFGCLVPVCISESIRVCV